MTPDQRDNLDVVAAHLLHAGDYLFRIEARATSYGHMAWFAYIVMGGCGRIAEAFQQVGGPFLTVTEAEDAAETRACHLMHLVEESTSEEVSI